MIAKLTTALRLLMPQSSNTPLSLTTMQIQGIKHGNTIQLPQELDLPDGQILFIQILPQPTLPTEQHQQLQALFGILDHQPDLDHAFQDIDCDRHQYQGRSIATLD